jgi:hypothetical protein
MSTRTALFSAFGFAIFVTAAMAADAPRGAYVSLTASDAAACARACANDGICMAWSFERDNRCQLRAVVPGEPLPHALASGYAARAPAFLQPRTPLLHDPASIEPETVAAPQAPEPVETATGPADDGMLLGGPSDGDLRLGMR